MNNGSRSLFLFSAVVTSAALVYAQAVSYDVVSVKPNDSGSQSSSTTSEHGRLTAINVTVESLIRNAYHVEDFQIVNAPGWADSARFDIVAKADVDPSPTEGCLMMQTLLAERFKLTIHHETREMGVYDLVLARPDGKLGSGLHRAECAQRTCGNTHVNSTVLHAEGITLEFFNETLSSITRRVVNQKTGLEGPFDIDLVWSRDQSTDTTRPSIFTALQEQLGLKLEPARGPVDVLVIDRLERPSPD